VGLVNNLPHSLQVMNKVVAFLFCEGDDTVNGRMSLEEGSNLLIQHKMYLRLRKVVAQSVEERSGENRIAHLTKSYNEYIHGGKDTERIDN
jgi:hypothetical protein